MKRVVVSWSSGKDCAWMLHMLRKQDDMDVIALLTTFNDDADRVSMHAVRRTLVEAQAEAAGLPLWSIPLPWPCSNDGYEQKMAEAVERAANEGATHVAFGDIHLRDVRAYREEQMARTKLRTLFPLWHPAGGTASLANEMLRGGMRATVTCVDPEQIDASFVGRTYDADFLADLPESCDPCGENGEFHTFCHGGPMFAQAIPVKVGVRQQRDRFWYADLLPLSDAA